MRGRSRRGLIAALLLFGTSAGIEAAVKLVVRPDGTKYLYDDGKGRGSRPRSGVLAVPRQDLQPMIERYADLNRLDESLVRAVIQVESAYDVAALSNKGAMGLMQLMPTTARELGVSDPFDADQNIRGGTAYLRRMLDTFDERLELALAAYNAGPQAVKRFRGIPPYRETRNYVEKVIRLHRGDSTYTASASPYLRAGGKAYLYRDAGGKLRMTSSPPRTNR